MGGRRQFSHILPTRPSPADFDSTAVSPILMGMDQRQEIELVFAPQDEGGYHVYAPDLPGLHTQGDTLEEATANAQEALDL